MPNGKLAVIENNTGNPKQRVYGSDVVVNKRLRSIGVKDSTKQAKSTVQYRPRTGNRRFAH